MKKLLFFCMALMSFLFCKEENMQIKLKFDDEIILIQMDESPAAKQFMSLLPLRLKFSDYANKEKISPALNPALTQKGKANYEPETGDFFYFAHWKNLGIFYEKQPAHSGLFIKIKGKKRRFLGGNFKKLKKAKFAGVFNFNNFRLSFVKRVIFEFL